MEAARALEDYDPAVFDLVPPPTLRAVEALGDHALHDPALAAALRRRCRHAEGLTGLLSRRADLLGVSRVADHFAEYVRWGV